MKLLKRLEQQNQFWYLLFICIGFFFLRFPSLFDPYWYGDEGIYQVVGMALREGRFLYQDIWDNKPPLLYLIYVIFNSDQFWVRLFSLFFGTGAVVAFYTLSKKLFQNTRTAFITTAFFALLFGTPYLEGTIANAENFMLFPILVAANLVVYFGPRKLFFAGILLSLAFLFKAVAVFDLAAFALFVIIVDYKNRKYIVRTFENIVFLGIGFLLPIFATILYFLINGALLEFLKAAFVQNVGYVGYGNKLFIPQGFLIVKLILLIIISALLFMKREKINTTLLFIILWSVFSLFNAFFSARPYTHYMLVFLPCFCLLIGVFLEYERQRLLLGIGLLLLVIVLKKNFWTYGKIFRYYPNFFAYVTGNKSLTSYRAFFDKNVPNDYLIADFLKLHLRTGDQILIWGNNAQVYKLVGKLPPGRFTVAYHMSFSPNAVSETKQAIEKTVPRFIVVMPNQPPPPVNLTNYRLQYTVSNIFIYEHI